jgi:hypothetical protein
MEASGNLLKMRTVYNQPVDYYLTLGSKDIYMNELIDHQIALEYHGLINCVHCGIIIKKSYGQGFCYQCLQTAPEADQSVVRPELSLAHFGIARDLDWAREHDLIEHYVYLAITNDLKVGVTRHHQIPTRWIDQGAIQAIRLARTPNRHIAGVIEHFLKQHVADITQWQAMLKGEYNQNIDLAAEKARISQLLPLELQRYLETDNQVQYFDYPGTFKADKVETLGFENTGIIQGKLTGIKGQYLLFGNSRVLNIRKYSGYYVKFRVNN